MLKLGLQAVIRRKKRIPNQQAKTAGHIYENILNREFKAAKRFNKRVTDVKEFRMGQTKLYLSAIMDLFNNEIIAYAISKRNDIPLVERTLKKAMRKAGTASNILIHSDQGMQYRSKRYHQLTKTYKMQVSMS